MHVSSQFHSKVLFFFPLTPHGEIPLCSRTESDLDLSYFAQKGWWERSQWRHQHNHVSRWGPTILPLSAEHSYCLPSLPAEILIQQSRPGLRWFWWLGQWGRYQYRDIRSLCSNVWESNPTNVQSFHPKGGSHTISFSCCHCCGRPQPALFRQTQDVQCGTFIGLWLSVVVLPNMLVPPVPKPEVVPNRLILALKR